MKPRIFVSSSVEARPLLHFLEEELSLEATVVAWSDMPFSIAQPPLAQFSQSVKGADFVVILGGFTEAVTARGMVEERPRDNIIFELGFFIGSLGSERVLVVDISPEKSLGLPAALAGLTVLRADPDKLNRPRELARRIAYEVKRRMRHHEPQQQVKSASYSCFISYSHEDAELAAKLYNDLTDIGAQCWIDQHELRLGDSILDQVTSALLSSDKFLPILSTSSMRSRWFETELRKALELEQRRATSVLVPIRVDDTIFSVQGGPWLVLQDRLIADFRDWRSDLEYRKAFRHLALNLAVSASEERASEAHR
jgi:predicted nucleotide-binding protein